MSFFLNGIIGMALCQINAEKILERTVELERFHGK